MKRVMIISAFFGCLLAFFCLMSCTGSCNESLTVSSAYCDGPFCYAEGDPVTLEGYSCFGCYWFPKACGCYGNDFTSETEGILPPSCVICGFDCTLLECYGHPEIIGTDIETRSVVLAKEGVDYIIDRCVITIDDHIQEFENGKFTLDDIILFVEMINVKDVVTANFYLEYTVLTELHSAEYECVFQYDDYILDAFDQMYSNGFHVKKGNASVADGQTNRKSQNITPGKHMIAASISLKIHEVLSFKGLEGPYFTAYTYGGDE